MELVYACQPFPQTFCKSLFLAGPTPRDAHVPSWRPQALALLESFGYDGVVFIPEAQDGQRSSDYDEQITWELDAMRRSDFILFWAPAERDTMPANTTRVEFGLQIHSGKVILGIPQGAYKTRYMENLAERHHIALHRTLEETVKTACNKLGPGARRSGAECLIPLEIWRTRHFQEWYASQTKAGHILEDAPNIEWILRVGPHKAFPLLFVIHVAIKVNGENRVKSNEVVIIRPSIVTVGAYCPGETRNQDRFILVKEYRTAVMNQPGFVFELPGGSSFKPDIDHLSLAMEELAKETGIRLPRERFQLIGKRQLAATLVANQSLLLAVALAPSEMDEIAANEGKMYGNRSETEQTYLHVMTRQQIIEGNLVDYVTLGQISLIG
ncbi:MAG: nucleoside 2-deoxyribosyltransferase domain-containing protein [Leptolyngbyaceae cyanobacterium MO_188.B28]|nr:nucleoside 2-deoxyribosyltransferase domain-containing protein [Leptolyngbyaceae cyanobacterium MO_188.B28]